MGRNHEQGARIDRGRQQCLHGALGPVDTTGTVAVVPEKTPIQFHRLLTAQGKELIVVFFPGKESSYRNVAPASLGLGRIIANVDEIFTTVSSSLKSSGVRYVEVDPMFREALGAGTRIYHPNDDEHPNSAGYGLVAKLLASAIGGGQPTKDHH